LKRILHVIKGLSRGGAEQLLVSQAPYLDRSRFQYEIAYLLPDHNALVEELENAGLPVHCLYGARGSQWVGRLRSLVRTRGIDLVHDHSPYVAIGTRLGVRRRSGLCLVYTEHNVWESYHKATYWGNLLTYSRSDRVFAASDHVRASIRYPRPFRFMPMPKVETLYHGVDPEAISRWGSSDGVRADLGIPEHAPLVGTVANFRPSKGHSVLLLAAAKVRRAIPEVRFLLVGHGPLESDIRRRASQLGLDGTVIFAGARDDAPRLAGAVDVFALPSVYEGLAIALIEAMALGRAAVVTRVGGLTEVIEDGKQGLLVNPGDPDALANAIVSLLQDADLRRKLGDAGRHRAAEFDIRKAVRRHEEVYAELLRC
jgi:glycosyltransferase involved in cell wall biosynthesis